MNEYVYYDIVINISWSVKGDFTQYVYRYPQIFMDFEKNHYGYPKMHLWVMKSNSSYPKVRKEFWISKSES